VLLLSGPTAAGKSTAAVRLAQQLGGEIICADSAQVYKFLDAATGKPTAQEREAVRHHVIDVADPARPVFTAGDFYRAAEEAAAGVIQRGRVPMVVGGAWLYLRFFLYGLPATVKPSEDIRRVAETLTKHHWPSWDSALSLLRVVDRPTAEKLPRNDWRKFQRALEVYFTAGKPMSQVDRQGAAPGSEDRKHLHRYDFRCVFLALGWSQLRRNAELRCEQFLRPGQLLEETVRLLCSGKLLVDTPPGRAIGYRQMIDALQHMARSNRGAFNDDDAASAAAAVAEVGTTLPLWRRRQTHTHLCKQDPLTCPGNKNSLSATLSPRQPAGHFQCYLQAPETADAVLRSGEAIHVGGRVQPRAATGGLELYLGLRSQQVRGASIKRGIQRCSASQAS